MTTLGGVARVDVFSVKGGVGKTTVSVALAHAQAAHSKKPVLLVDADLTGTCLGHLLAPAINGDWNQVHNLAHLICDPPETLDDALVRDRIPVYRLPSQHNADPKHHHVSRVENFAGQVLYCPSHGNSTAPNFVDPRVLQALVGHETAGGWVRLVIKKIIKATADVAGELGGVIVDHSPGMAALQTATLEDIGEAPGVRRALFVTTSDRVDLKMTSATVGHLKEELRGPSLFLVNRARSQWRELPHTCKKSEFDTPWVNGAHELEYSEALRKAYEKSDALPLAELRQLSALRTAVFGD
ncbi:MAG: P-loop NTPase [Myxococcales bacterium]|nr:P-loop NTPase [Myxococcales bacterium]